MGRELDLTGKEFDFLKVLNFHHSNYREDKSRKRIIKTNYWCCQCSCGKEVIRSTKSLSEKNKTHSCGCQLAFKAHRKAEEKNKKFPLYKEITERYHKIKERLYNPKSISFFNYGARGIKMCEEWKNDFMAFYTWSIQNGYRKELQIDRIDNGGDYCPENCRWVDRKTQNRNTRKNVYAEFNGEKKCLSEWAENLGIGGRTFWAYAKRHNNDYILTIKHYMSTK